MEVLITGGGGFLGRHLVQALVARGEAVRVLALPGEDVTSLEELGVAFHRGDICCPETLVGATQGAEAVVHLAGMIGVWRPLSDYVAANVTGTENVCRAALARGVRRVVHVSSWTVYGLDRGAPCHEDQGLAPFSEPYAISKAEGDRLVQRMIGDAGLPAAIVRPGTFFGPGDRLHFDRIADRVRRGRGLIIGQGNNALPLVYVTDVVQGLLLALDHPAAVGEAFNITNDAPLSQQEFLESIASEIGATPPRVHAPYPVLYAAASLAERLAPITRRQPPVTRLGVKLFGTSNRHAIDKARRELGYEPRVALREGVRRAASSYLRTTGSLAEMTG
jgi:nucleoside-diphosphate-sugar epimerase